MKKFIPTFTIRTEPFPHAIGDIVKVKVLIPTINDNEYFMIGEICSLFGNGAYIKTDDSKYVIGAVYENISPATLDEKLMYKLEK